MKHVRTSVTRRRAALSLAITALAIPFSAFATPTLTDLAINCSPAKSGASQTGYVYLSEPAPTGGTSVTLNSDTSWFTVPASVTVAEGNTFATFTIGTSTSHPTTGTLSATLNTDTFYETLVTTSTDNNTFCVAPYARAGGTSQNLTGYIHLSSAAGLGGETINLTNSNTALTVPSSRTISQGNISDTFSIPCTAVSSDSTGVVSASIRGSNYSTDTRVLPPWLKSVTLSTSSVTGGNSLTGFINLRQSAPVGGTTVSVTSDNTVVHVPTSVTVDAGGTIKSFTITTDPVGSTVTSTITASYNGLVKTVILTVNP